MESTRVILGSLAFILIVSIELLMHDETLSVYPTSVYDVAALVKDVTRCEQRVRGPAGGLGGKPTSPLAQEFYQ